MNNCITSLCSQACLYRALYQLAAWPILVLVYYNYEWVQVIHQSSCIGVYNLSTNFLSFPNTEGIQGGKTKFHECLSQILPHFRDLSKKNSYNSNN